MSWSSHDLFFSFLIIKVYSQIKVNLTLPTYLSLCWNRLLSQSKFTELITDFEACPLWPKSNNKYFLKHEVFQIRYLPIERNMRQFSSCFERWSVGYNFLSQILFEVSLDHIIILFLNQVIYEYIDKSFYLMSWNFQHFFDFTDILLRE